MASASQKWVAGGCERGWLGSSTTSITTTTAMCLCRGPPARPPSTPNTAWPWLLQWLLQWLVARERLPGPEGEGAPSGGPRGFGGTLGSDLAFHPPRLSWPSATPAPPQTLFPLPPHTCSVRDSVLLLHTVPSLCLQQSAPAPPAPLPTAIPRSIRVIWLLNTTKLNSPFIPTLAGRPPYPQLRSPPKIPRTPKITVAYCWNSLHCRAGFMTAASRS